MDPISPELVLVDPELARRARARLPDPTRSNGTVIPIPAQRFADSRPRRLVVGAGGTAHSTPPKVRSSPQRRPGRFLTLFAAGLCAFSLGVLVPQVVGGHNETSFRQPQALRSAQPTTVPRSAPSAGSPRLSTLPTANPQREARRAARPTGRVSGKREARRPKGAERVQRTSSAPPSHRDGRRATVPNDGVPTRLFLWLPRPGASYYNVQFLKGKRTVFEAWPKDARVTVPMRGTFRGRKFAFTNGRYRWIVRPAFGPRLTRRYGEPIVRSVWVVRP
jgi:hypothetical protein